VTSAVARGCWLRNERRNRSFAATWGFLAGGSLVAGVVVLALSAGDGKPGGGLAAFAVFALMALGSGWYALGCARAGLFVADDHVLIRNPTRTREIASSDVVRFSAGDQPGRYGNPTPGVLLEVAGGRSYPVWTFAREGFVWHSRQNAHAWLATADSLNALVRRSTSGR
jgi:hypothetical protein